MYSLCGSAVKARKPESNVGGIFRDLATALTDTAVPVGRLGGVKAGLLRQYDTI